MKNFRIDRKGVRNTTNLKVGDKFPAIEGESTSGDTGVSSFVGKNAVVYFYPKDNTPGCTKEAKDFRDFQEEFKKANTEIIGISTDSTRSHAKFADKYGLNFTLLSDKSKTICRSCGVMGLTGTVAKRTTFLLDKEGVIRNIWEDVSVRGHAEDVLNKIKELNLE